MNNNVLLITALLTGTSAIGGVITSVPGPDAQGGMIMPMVTIINTDNATNPTEGDISISFNPSSVPVLRSLSEWSPGNWFAETAAWRADLSPPVGVGGTPLANAGNGDLFNNQYGFMFMSMPMEGMANIPSGKSLAIRLLSVSSGDLGIFNYRNDINLWDPVLGGIGSQVLWNGSMWHGYFTLPADAAAGTYTAEFEVFIADTTFTSGGWVDYTPAALAAAQDPNFTAATVSYEFTVIPEPGAYALALGALMLVFVAVRRCRPACRKGNG